MVDKEGKIAVPCSGKGGLEDKVTLHFGRAKTFTVVKLENGEVTSTEKVKNPGHEQGHCMKVLGTLKGRGVYIILVGGMGRMAFKVCNDLGIDVYYGLGEETVKEAVSAYLSSGLKSLREEQLCNKLLTCD